MVNIQTPKKDPPSNEMMETLLIFTIGQEVESKSHAQGYRGAWFKCKIEDIDKGGRGQLRFKLRYLNFPDEALHWSQAYQQRQRGNAATFELMIRPPMPPLVHEQDLHNAVYDGLVVVPRTWEAGDLVNFWCDDVWWECTVSEIVDHETVKVSLFKPPHGEGGTHSVKGKDLRPSLVWTLVDGWSLPPLKKQGRQCARLVRLSSMPRSGSDLPFKVEQGPFFPDTLDFSADTPIRNQVIATMKVEDKSFRPLDSGGTHGKTVPSLSALRSVVEPLNYTDDDDSGKDADSDISDTEAAEAAELHRLKLMQAKKRSQQKIEISRKVIRKSVAFARSMSIQKQKLKEGDQCIIGENGLHGAYLRCKLKFLK